MAKLLCGLILMVFLPLQLLASEDKVEQQLTELERTLLTEPAKASSLFEQLEPLIDEFTPAQITRYYCQLSIQAMLNGDYRKAIDILKRALKAAKTADELINVYHFLSTAELSIKNYDMSLLYAQEVLKLVEDIDAVNVQIKAYNRIFNVFFQLGAYEEAREYAVRAYRLNKGVDAVNQCTSLLYIGLGFLFLDELEPAHTWLDESLTFCSAQQLPLMVAMAQKAKGNSYIKSGEFELALERFLGSLSGYQATGYLLEIVSVESWLAQNYFELAKYDIALMYARRVLDRDNLSEHLESRKRVVKVVAEISYIRGDYQQAYDYQQTYLELTEALLSDTSAKSLAYQMAKFDSDEKDRQINMLEQERGSYVEQREADYQQQANATLILFLLSGGLVICFVGVLVSMKQRSRYKRMALMDGLTGVHNRATGMEKAENTYVQLMAKQSVMGVVVLDLDNFKQINDKHGHSSGDWALKKVVETIKHKLRRMDIIVRLSGGDFVLFLPDMPATDAAALAESIRQSIMEMKPQLTEHSFILSASFGVSVSNDMDLSLDPVIKRAEIALRQAKESGKNQVAIYGKPTQTKSHPIE